jgi:glycosyltransferase involved in cell wall biosynthesis
VSGVPARRPLLHAIGWFAGTTGYVHHTRAFFGELARRRPAIATNLSAPGEEVRINLELIRRHAPLDDGLVNIALVYGHLAGGLGSCPGHRIAYTVWESTRLPEAWRAPLATADRIWIPSRWGRDVLVANGYEASRIDVVPEGVDLDVFHPATPPAAAILARRGFRFLYVGKWEARKFTPELIKAFDDEFHATPDVHLVLACDNPFVKEFDLGARLRALRLRSPEKLLFVRRQADQRQIARLYASCHAFVHPTRAEGWGLPVLEAMATGLPVIVTGYSALTDFATPDVTYWLDHRMVDIDHALFEPDEGPWGQWAAPDVAHLRALMREVFEHPIAARDRGRAAATAARAWSWRHAADAAEAALRRLPSGPPVRPLRPVDDRTFRELDG